MAEDRSTAEFAHTLRFSVTDPGAGKQRKPIKVLGRDPLRKAVVLTNEGGVDVRFGFNQDAAGQNLTKRLPTGGEIELRNRAELWLDVNPGGGDGTVELLVETDGGL